MLQKHTDISLFFEVVKQLKKMATTAEAIKISLHNVNLLHFALIGN